MVNQPSYKNDIGILGHSEEFDIEELSDKCYGERLRFFWREDQESIRLVPDAKEIIHSIAERLCELHPSISIDEEIYGGSPHIRNVRLSVGDILAALYKYGSIKSTLEIYGDSITEEQIKESIAYAQDFLELAYDPSTSFEDYG